MITTQTLFDGILTHVRLQGGHGPYLGHDTTGRDGCKCVKGIWGANSINSGSETVYWAHGIEDRIGRELTRDELYMFDALEIGYESHRALSPHCKRIDDLMNKLDDSTRETMSIQAYLPAIYSIKDNVGSGPSDGDAYNYRFMPAAFEIIAKLVAEELELDYTPPGQWPTTDPTDYDDVNTALANEMRENKEVLENV